jgi:hypothetical protein
MVCPRRVATLRSMPFVCVAVLVVAPTQMGRSQLAFRSATQSLNLLQTPLDLSRRRHNLLRAVMYCLYD